MKRWIPFLALLGCSSRTPVDSASSEPSVVPPPIEIRVASYNTSLFQEVEGRLAQRLTDPSWERARNVAAILQEIRPDIVLLNEFDTDLSEAAARRFRDNFLAVSQGDRDPIDYPYAFVAPVNTGVPTGFDLDRNGQVDTTPGSNAYANDCHGYGTFEGQYGMLVLSRYPIVGQRTFQLLRWSDIPDPGWPSDPATQTSGDWYSDAIKDVLRLSSKSHWDLSIDVEGHALHLLASHPTPPAFDGPERRNVQRNLAEVRFWVDYLSAGAEGWMVDDEGARGGLGGGSFVIVGDLNADPNDGQVAGGSISDLVGHPRVHQGDVPASVGAVESSATRGGVNATHVGDPAHDTAEWNPNTVGNLRVDYALPSADLEVLDSGVFWPASTDPAADLLGQSDHHAVWVDVRLGGS
jgi:endonuclease/exonuclease/phosphatase family metal-dependent hydrolase